MNKIIIIVIIAIASLFIYNSMSGSKTEDLSATGTPIEFSTGQIYLAKCSNMGSIDNQSIEYMLLKVVSSSNDSLALRGFANAFFVKPIIPSGYVDYSQRSIPNLGMQSPMTSGFAGLESDFGSQGRFSELELVAESTISSYDREYLADM